MDTIRKCILPDDCDVAIDNHMSNIPGNFLILKLPETAINVKLHCTLINVRLELSWVEGGNKHNNTNRSVLLVVFDSVWLSWCGCSHYGYKLKAAQLALFFWNAQIMARDTNKIKIKRFSRIVPYGILTKLKFVNYFLTKKIKRTWRRTVLFRSRGQG